MGIFDKLSAIAAQNKATASLLSTPSAPPPNPPPTENQVTPAATAAAEPIDQQHEPTELDDESWDVVQRPKADEQLPPSASKGTPSSKGPLQFTENKLIKVDPSELVWAPFYRFGDKLFPARLSRQEELVFDPSVPVTLDDNVVIVEFFSQVKSSRTCLRATVIANKVLPYWANRSDDDERSADKSYWNANRLKALRKALRDSNESAKNANLIYEMAVGTANKFLELALKDSLEMIKEQGDDATDEALDENAPLVLNDSTLDESEVAAEAHASNKSNSVLAFAYRDNEDLHDVDLDLHIGDSIRYHQPIFGHMVTSAIVGFSKDALHPLLLDDNFVLGLDDFIGKVETSPSSVDKEIPAQATVASKRPRDESNALDSEGSSRAKRARRADHSQTNTTSKPEAAPATNAHGRLVPLRKFSLITSAAVTTDDSNNDEDDDDDKRLIDVVAAAADHGAKYL